MSNTVQKSLSLLSVAVSPSVGSRNMPLLVCGFRPGCDRGVINAICTRYIFFTELERIRVHISVIAELNVCSCHSGLQTCQTHELMMLIIKHHNFFPLNKTLLQKHFSSSLSLYFSRHCSLCIYFLHLWISLPQTVPSSVV